MILSIVSYRSEKKENSLIANLVIGLKIVQLKAGVSCRSEHLVKHYQLIQIKESLGDHLLYTGMNYWNLQI